MNKGVFWAVLAALLVFSIIVIVSDGFRRYLVWREIEGFFRQMQEQTAAETVRAQRQAQQRKAVHDAQARADLRARTLAPDQQCVAGSVVTVRPNFAEQMVRDGRIVHCKGRLADVPIR